MRIVLGSNEYSRFGNLFFLIEIFLLMHRDIGMMRVAKSRYDNLALGTKLTSHLYNVNIISFLKLAESYKNVADYAG